MRYGFRLSPSIMTMAKLHECVTFLLIFVYTFSVPITTLIRFAVTNHAPLSPRRS
jgi:hypothetical protein